MNSSILIKTEIETLSEDGPAEILLHVEREVERARYLLSGVDPEKGIILLRQIRSLLTERWQKVNYSVGAAMMDPEVTSFLLKGHQEKNRQEFDKLEYSMWRCISVYPDHPECNFNYALALFHQDKLTDSEVFFRNSIALGVSLKNSQPYLQDVARRQGSDLILAPGCKINKDFKEPINAIYSLLGNAWLYPDVPDIRRLCGIIGGKRDWSLEAIRQLQRSSRTYWDLISNLLETEEFRAGNLDFMYVLNNLNNTSPV